MEWVTLRSERSHALPHVARRGGPVKSRYNPLCHHGYGDPEHAMDSHSSGHGSYFKKSFCLLVHGGIPPLQSSATFRYLNLSAALGKLFPEVRKLNPPLTEGNLYLEICLKFAPQLTRISFWYEVLLVHPREFRYLRDKNSHYVLFTQDSQIGIAYCWEGSWLGCAAR